MKASELETKAAALYHKLYPQSNYYRTTSQQQERFRDIVRLESK